MRVSWKSQNEGRLPGGSIVADVGMCPLWICVSSLRLGVPSQAKDTPEQLSPLSLSLFTYTVLSSVFKNWLPAFLKIPCFPFLKNWISGCFLKIWNSGSLTPLFFHENVLGLSCR